MTLVIPTERSEGEDLKTNNLLFTFGRLHNELNIYVLNGEAFKFAAAKVLLDKGGEVVVNDVTVDVVFTVVHVDMVLRDGVKKHLAGGREAAGVDSVVRKL